ncbi:MAG TPA: TOBE domain-containing protein, partial [Longimicrobiales bacterium]
GSPETLYAAPVNDFVASFVGHANLTAARITAVQGDRVSCELPGGAHWIATPAAGTSFRVGSRARVLSRPEFLKLIRRADDVVPGDVGGVVSERRYAGAQTYYHVTLADGELIVLGGPRSARVGDTVHVRLNDGTRVIVFPEPEA